MFRLFCAASLSGTLLVCGSALRSTVLCDTGGAVVRATCGGCGATVIADEGTGRRGPCRCEPRRTPDRPRPGLIASR